MIELTWNDPISEAKMATYISALELRSEHRVLDVGCGCGEVLIRLHETYRVQAVGVDSAAEQIAEANQRSKGRVDADAVRFVEMDASSLTVDRDMYDLVICMGATHAFGLGSDAYRNALRRIVELVVDGGLILIADGYMKQPAADGYRKLLGEDMPDEMTHAANVATGKQLGLIALSAWTSSEDEWDEFEWNYQRVIERKAERQPDDPKLIAKRDQRREWMDAYLKWGRDTLGYGIYLFKKPLAVCPD